MIRDYQESDFGDCVKLVNKVWEFDKHFAPLELAQLFLKIYTGSALSESNFLKVVEEQGQIRGFLFGKIENQPLHTSELRRVWGQWRVILRLLFMRAVTFNRKLVYLHKINSHEINRRKVEARKSSEVNLFVVDPDSQGQGWGKKLINEFIETCRERGVKRIVLETDNESNYGFYEHLGFRMKASFYSPLLEEFSGKTGETYVYELGL